MSSTTTTSGVSVNRTVLTGGVALGLGVAAWTLVMGFSGLYRHPTLSGLFFLVVPMQIGVLIWALRRTRAAGKGYGGQVMAGAQLSVIAAPIVFVQSYLFTAVIFPSYFSDIRAVYENILREQGLDEAAIAQALQQADTPTSFGQALTGAVATIITGLFVSAIAAVFIRDKH